MNMKRILTKKKIKKKRKEHSGSLSEGKLLRNFTRAYTNNITNNSCCLIFLSLYKTIAMIGSTTLGQTFTSSFLYTQILILSFSPSASQYPQRPPQSHWFSFLCVLLLNPLFSQPNGNETHRYPVVLFSPLVLSLCFSLFCCRFRFPFSFLRFFCFFDWFLSHVYCSASAVFLIDWFHQGTNYVYEFSQCYFIIIFIIIYILYFNFQGDISFQPTV